MHPTITQEQAQQRVHRYIADFVETLGAGRLEEVMIKTGPCTNPTDNGPGGRVQASQIYFIRGIPTERNDEVYQSFRGWLSRNDFRVLEYEQNPERFLWAENNGESFRIGLKESSTEERVLSIGAVSPCVWPNGTPEPEPA